jgi:alkaline phosphatase D
VASTIAPKRILPSVLLFVGSAFTALGQTISGGAWSGNVTATSATASIRVGASGLPVRLAVGLTEALSNPKYFGPVTSAGATGNVVSVDASGLQPNTDYFYGFEVQGALRTETISRGKFHTFPVGASSFKLLIAADADPADADQRAFAAMLAEQPLLFINLGDMFYRDTNTTTLDEHLQNYDVVLNSSTEGPLYRGMGLAYMWDDHDYCGDNSDGTSAGRVAAQNAYRMRVPHYPLGTIDGTVGQAFTVGRVRVIMTDLRSGSASASTPESASKSRLGVTQKAWFKQELLSARDAGFPLIFWVCTTPWIDAAKLGADTWGGYAAERTEIANFLRDNRIKNVVLLSADMHALAYDDGTHSDYATGGGLPLIVIQSASITSLGNAKGGPYTAGPFEGPTQYGILEITDTGGSSILCRFTGKRVGEGAKLSFQFSSSAAAIDTNLAVGTLGPVDRALVNISARGRLAAPGDTLIAGFVISGKSSRSILVRAVGPSLAEFGVADAVNRPAMVLFQQSTVVASNSDWGLEDSARLTTAFDRAGAFRFKSTSSRDAAMLLTLAPGSYTVQGAA